MPIWTLVVALATLSHAGTYGAPANGPSDNLPPAPGGEAVQQITQEITSPHTEESVSTPRFLPRRDRSALMRSLEVFHGCGDNDTLTTLPCQTEPVECSDVELIVVAAEGDVVAVEGRLPAGANVTVCGRTPLLVAVLGGHLETVRALLSSGDNANAQTRAVDENERTPLHHAAMNGREDIARLLVAAGADVSVADKRFYTPLHWASIRAYGPVVKFLLEMGADVNARASGGFTPLHLVALRGDASVTVDLLSAGADVEAKTTLGYTALMYAAIAERPAIVRLLLAHGADVNASSMGGRTALHRAASNRNSEIVEALLEAGADAGARDDEGRTPLFYARREDVRLALERRRWRSQTHSVPSFVSYRLK